MVGFYNTALYKMMIGNVINSNTSLQMYVRNSRHDMDGHHAYICDNCADCTRNIHLLTSHNKER